MKSPKRRRLLVGDETLMLAKDSTMLDLENRLQSLEINISEDVDGGLTVYTTAEPLFCFVRRTHEEVLDVVKDTLNSYITHFYDKNARVLIEVKEAVPIREVRLEKSRRLSPVFSSSNNSNDFALA